MTFLNVVVETIWVQFSNPSLNPRSSMYVNVYVCYFTFRRRKLHIINYKSKRSLLNCYFLVSPSTQQHHIADKMLDHHNNQQHDRIEHENLYVINIKHSLTVFVLSIYVVPYYTLYYYLLYCILKHTHTHSHSCSLRYYHFLVFTLEQSNSQSPNWLLVLLILPLYSFSAWEMSDLTQ